MNNTIIQKQLTKKKICQKLDTCMLPISKNFSSDKILFDTSNGFLMIGTDSDNYFFGSCATYNHFVKFSITDISLVSVFRLVHVKFDDYLELKLNGNIFYVGPDGGDYLEIKNREIEQRKAKTIKEVVLIQEMNVKNIQKKEEYTTKITVTEVFNGYEYKPCERNTNWNQEVDVDLKPYLNTGENILEMKLLVSGGGDGWLKIEAKQQCCGQYLAVESYE